MPLATLYAPLMQSHRYRHIRMLDFPCHRTLVLGQIFRQFEVEEMGKYADILTIKANL